MKASIVHSLTLLVATHVQAQTAPSVSEQANENPPALPAHEAPAVLPASVTYNDQPQIRADVLMVSLPQDKALALLPELRNPNQVAEAQAKLLKMITTKEATLIDWPEITFHSGHRADSETILEQRYPIEFDQPTEAQTLSPYPKRERTPAEESERALRLAGILFPTTFETRNTGVTLDVAGTVSKDGNSATLALTPQLVRLEKMNRFATTTVEQGNPAFVEQPVFQTRKVSGSQTLRSGERRLIYFGRPMEPGGQIELFILGLQIFPSPAAAK